MASELSETEVWPTNLMRPTSTMTAGGQKANLWWAMVAFQRDKSISESACGLIWTERQWVYWNWNRDWNVGVAASQRVWLSHAWITRCVHMCVLVVIEHWRSLVTPPIWSKSTLHRFKAFYPSDCAEAELIIRGAVWVLISSTSSKPQVALRFFFLFKIWKFPLY